ncbi:MAG: hypothetical protein NTX93_06010 [Bacteroidia bacterium]|nr:hypothetical protein [Bacteroidia bacterium]
MFKTLFFSIWLLFHPVHVTLTSIDYVPEMDSFKVFVRMYFDDFLRDNKLNGKEIQNKDFSTDNSSSRNVLEKYLAEKVIIEVNEKQLSGKLQDINLVDNEISMNLVYSTWKKPKTITVKNLIMTGLYSDQSNMIIIRINDFEEGVKLTADKTEQTFKIK